ncbi:uncharacterized protein [Typha latifolia]|uniref:uncharacterized protein n=1 Tax=Typha latifolia TaxID=4733 RepID=UPI003C303485
MGDLQTWPLHVNGNLGDSSPPLSQSPRPNPEPLDIKIDAWRLAEQATRELIQHIQPTVASERSRRTVIEYVQRLIRGYLGSEVFPFGSVPLKTYLPDGDIDLTAFGIQNSEDSLANDVHAVLELEEHNKDSEFEVKDVQYIHAEVKLVKCLVQNIVVDISFNQIGGLCTLCFLEQVDQLIGKDHLFKRSIMLIKAWCYYESRILGAHHGLISTYALETLVLYIFHIFHKSLDGPLVVLYRFLDYYSKFDWENYCVSLYGPVALSSLPELVAEPPETPGNDLLLSNEFLRRCVDRFSVPLRGFEHHSRIFPQKHLNIVDPLKQNNNLGRSVSKGNFFRIRSAFIFGARKLGQILLLPAESIGDEVSMFFRNTLERHGSGERPDVQDTQPGGLDSTAVDQNNISLISSDLNFEAGKKDKLNIASPTNYSSGVLCEQFNDISISTSQKDCGISEKFEGDSSSEHMNASWRPSTQLEPNGMIEGIALSGKRLTVDDSDLATSRGPHSKTDEETSTASPSTSETGCSPNGKAYYAPHLFFLPENGAKNEVANHINPSNSGTTSKVYSSSIIPFDDEHSYETESSGSPKPWSWNSGITSTAGSCDGPTTLSWNASPSEDPHRADCSTARKEINGNGGAKVTNLSDLTGDYEIHFRNLLYAQGCQDYIMGPILLPFQRPTHAQYRNKHSWNGLHRPNMYTYPGSNGVIPGPPFSPGCYLVNHPILSGAYSTEDIPKPRGTGTYFPNTNVRSYRERLSPGRGKKSPANPMAKPHKNSRAEVPSDTISAEEAIHEPAMHSQIPNGSNRGRPNPAEIAQSPRPAMRGISHGNGVVYPQENKLEFGSFGPVPVVTLPDVSNRLDSASPRSHSPSSMNPMQKPGMSSNRERTIQPYRLKDVGDFPPLTG